MSVVGLTFGSGANAIRPSAASAASVGHEREHARARVRALVPGEADGERGAEEHEGGEHPAHATTSRDCGVSPLSRSSAAPSSGSSAPRRRGCARSRSRSTSRPPAPRPPARRRSAGRRRAAPCAARRPAANSASCVATTIAAARRGERAQLRGERGLVRAVHPARRLVEADAPPGGSPCEHDREREPLALAAGEVARVAVGERAEPGRGERLRRQLVADALVQRVVARVLEQQRDAARALHLPARGRRAARRRAQQRRLPRAVAAHQRDALARRDRSRRPAARPRRPGLVPRRPRARAPRAARCARARAGGVGRASRRRRQSAGARSARGPSFTPPAAGAAPRARTAARPASAAPARLARPGEERARRRRRRRPRRRAIATTRSAAARQRSSRCSARTTAVPHSSLSRRSSQISSSPATGSSCEVGSSSSTEPRAPGQRRAERDALQLAAGELVRRAVEQVRDPERERRLLHPARDGGGRPGRGSRAGRPSSARTVPITTCVSGSWNSEPATAASSAGPCSRVSSPPTSRRPPNSPPWKCGTSPQAARSSVDLPEPERAGQHDELALPIVSETSRSAGHRGARVVYVTARRARRVASDRERRVIGAIPRRSANGSSAHSASAARAPSTRRVDGRRRSPGRRRTRDRPRPRADRQRDERRRRRGEREVVARPRPPHARRPAGRAP